MNATNPDAELPIIVAFPLPYRVLVLIGLGILGWVTNLQGLEMSGIDVVAALDIRAEGFPPRTPLSLHHMAGFNQRPETRVIFTAMYRIFAIYSFFCFFSWSLFGLYTHRDILLVDEYGYIPAFTAAALLATLFCPLDVAFKNERLKFLRTIRRCLFSSIESPIYFSDVVFADIGTSFAKVFGDIWLSIWMLMPGNSMLHPPIIHGWMKWILPGIMSLPFAVRFRQCVLEYNSSSNESRRPLYNALKYATSFPVIFLSAAQRIVVVDLTKAKGDLVVNEAWHGEHPLFRLWLLAAAVNSIYSFWWDLTNDWGLDLLKFEFLDLEPPNSGRSSPPRRLVLPHIHSHTPVTPSRDSLDSQYTDEAIPTGLSNSPSISPRQKYPWGLRQTLLFPLPIYPVFIFFNLILRMTWSIKLSSHLHSELDGSFSFFWLEMAEMARRWLWVFLRVEWEVIKKAREGKPKEHLDEDDADYEMLHTGPVGYLPP